MSIIGTLPNTIVNGGNIDANPIMNDFNYIVSQVNTNVPLATVAAATYASTATTQVPTDNTTSIATDAFVQTAVASSASVVGAVRNARMYVSAAGSTATFTADEIMVEVALGGAPYKLASYSQSINLSTTGAGGMDTGTAPVSGFVALYAIYGTSGTSILACNASTLQGNVYGGSHMPAGYTYSALIAVWPTDGTGKLQIGEQIDRSLKIPVVTILSTSTTQAAYTSATFTACPLNAKSADVFVVPTSVTGADGFVIANISGSSAFPVNVYDASKLRSSAAYGSTSAQFPTVILTTPQTLYYTFSLSTVTGATLNISINGYSI